MKNLLVVVALLLGFVVPDPVSAASYEAALDAFNEGRFEEAVALGKEVGTADGYALAARGQLVLIQYIYAPEKREAVIETAIKNARKALDLEPDHIEATINLGIAIGLRGKLNRSISDGKEARDLFEKAIEMDPDNTWALGSLGSWHGETLDEAGAVGARLIMGARKKHMFSNFEQAIEHGPGNLVIRAAFVRSLMRLNPEKYEEDIVPQIDFILNAPADNALDEIMKAQICQVKTAWRKNQENRLENLLEEALPLKLVDNYRDC